MILELTQYEIKLIEEIREIINHGSGVMVISVGPFSTDETKIQIEAGRIYRYIVKSK